MNSVAFRRLSLLGLSVLVAGSLALPAAAGSKKFVDSDAAKEKDEPQSFLPDYDKLVEGSEADWVYFNGYDAKAIKTVKIKEYGVTGKGRETRDAAEDGPEYLDQWISRSKKLGWEVVKSGKADLTIEGNVAHAWEPSGAARFWGGWYANPGVVQELIGKDASGKIIFEIRHKSKGSTIRDAVENGLEDVVKTLEKGK